MACSLTMLWLASLALAMLATQPLASQTSPRNTGQQLVFAGLRSVAAQGQFNAIQADTAGNLYLLLDQKDGVRVLKADNTGSTLLAQAQLGSAGDVGLALALDSSGNVYVTGTTTSTALTATPGAAIASRTDTSTNSFVAKFNSSLTVQFVSFTGGSRITASAIAATADAVFVTGSLFAANLPVTQDGIQQSPATGSTQNGFVERFSADGSTLVYATYLTGAQGNTMPAAIAADPADDAYIAGATTSTGFPTVAALVPASLSDPSGFLTKLTPAGDSITFSTFIPGQGLTSLGLDTTGETLLASGAVASGQFPVETVLAPLAPLTYQTLLRLPLDGSSVQSSVLLAPGTQSFLAPVAGGAVWVGQTLSAALLPISPFSNLGSGVVMRVTAQNAIDQLARFGGLPNANTTYASLPLTVTSVAVDPAANALLTGSVAPTASSSLLASETYDLPLSQPPPSTLPSSVRSSETTAASCTGSLCAGSAGYLAKLNPAGGLASLLLSIDDAPFLVLRNPSGAAATNLQVTATGATTSTNCPSTLASGGECDILLTGTSAATVTVTATNATTQTASVPAFPAASSKIVFFPKELDFGIQTSTSPAGQRTLTVSNLGDTAATFTSTALIAPKATTPFSEVSSDCAASGATTNKLLAAGATCHIVLGLTAAAAPSSDGYLQQYWQIGTRAVLLTGYSQAAALSVSATEVDFGTQYKAGLRLPRFLYLSNASVTTSSHNAVVLPANAAFTATDNCPTVLAAQSVCSIRLDYLPASYPSRDSVTLALDQGLSVLVTGQSLPQPGVGGSVVNPNLTVGPSSLTFANSVPVTEVGASQTVTVANTGASAFSLSLVLTGDFSQQTSCPASFGGGQSCSVAITFVPSQPGVRQGLLAVTAGAGFSPAYVTLSGTATDLLPANNGILDFGSSPIGQPVTTFYKIAQPVSSLSAATTGAYSVTFLQNLGYGPGNPPSTAFASTATASCSSCYLAVRFLPTAAGSQPGMLALTSVSGGMPYTLSLTGVGLPTSGLLLTPLLASFGTVPVDSTSAPLLFTLTNLSASAAPITVTSIAASGDFFTSSAPTGGQTCSGSLAYTASCLLNLTFSPAATGTRTGSLTLATSGGTATAALSGSATPDQGISLSPTALVFNNVPGAQATVQAVTVTNSGLLPVLVGQPTTGSTGFAATSACGDLAAAASCTIQVQFQPANSLLSGVLTIPITATSAGGTVTNTLFTVPLKGNYASTSAGLQVTPAQAVFGPQAVAGESSARQLSITNLSTQTLNLTLSVPRQFALLGSSCTTLAAGSSCTLSAAFLPLTNAELTGSLVIQATPADVSSPLTSIAYLDGYGTTLAGPLTIVGAPASGVISFGQVTSGQTATRVLTLTNQNAAGSPSITIHRVMSGPPFLATSSCRQPLAPGQSCPVTLSYSPTNQVATGTASPPNLSDTGVLTLESDASSSPDLVDLAGQAGPTMVASPSNASPLAAFTLSQSSLTFPSTAVGNISPGQSVTLTNSGTAVLHILSIFTSADFAVQSSCSTLLAGASCTLTVASTPQSPGTHVAALQIASDSTVSLEFVTLLAPATAAALTFSPTSLAFGSIVVGSSSAALPVQVINESQAPVSFASIQGSVGYQTATDCPTQTATLASGQSCSVQVTFTPSQAGSRPGVLSFVTSGSTNPLTVPLSGTGIQSQLIATPSPLAFGSIDLGASAALTLMLTNNGTATLSQLSLSITGDYAISRPCTLSVLSPQQSCVVGITFTPTMTGARPATLTIRSTDASSPLVLPITGTGLAGGSFTLTVNGGTSATQTVTPPTPATFALLLTPVGGFSGQVAFTCTALNTTQYISCSLQPSSITLAGAPQTIIATVNTVSAVPLVRRAEALAGEMVVVACLPCLLSLRRRKSRVRMFCVSGLIMALLIGTNACSSNSTPNVRLAGGGNYAFSVTATSTSGTSISQSVTLNVDAQ